MAVLILGSFQAGLAAAATGQTNWFTIWGYNVDMWTGTANNYHHSPWCVTSCAYDYMIPINAQVRQTAAGWFYWETFELSVGNVFSGGCCQYAWKGHLWVYADGNPGTLVADSTAFNCDDVRTYGSLAVGTVASQTRAGHWDQDSGAGGAGCFTSYVYTDKWVVTGQ